MANIIKFSGYFVNDLDSEIDITNISSYLNNPNVALHHLIVEKSAEFTVTGELDSNCSVDLLESHFE